MKKFLRKSLFILLTLLSVIFVVACGDKDKLSKKEVIEKFVENSKNIKSADIAMNMKMEQKNSNNSAGVSMEASGDISMMLEPVAAKIDIAIPFSNTKMKMYVKDDYMYAQNPYDNQWVKQANKGFSEQFKKAMAESNMMYDFFLNNIDKIDLKEKGGNYILSVNDLKDIFKTQFKTMNIPEADFNVFDNMILTFLIDKKTFLPINFTLSGTMDVENIKMDFLFEVKYSNINKVKEIIIPKEALEAKEEKALEEIENINLENKK